MNKIIDIFISKIVPYILFFSYCLGVAFVIGLIYKAYVNSTSPQPVVTKARPTQEELCKPFKEESLTWMRAFRKCEAWKCPTYSTARCIEKTFHIQPTSKFATDVEGLTGRIWIEPVRETK